uniref:Uncharacterized protein n=1 Tax=Avena sativa TaxID=4498 RepID=A0ACD5VPM4_AVESA
METLAMDSNFFSGSIPPSFGNLKGLQGLNLTSNNLSGPIPDELGRISVLEELCLAQNNLSGGIPALLGNLSSLLKLDLSHNRLEGPVPMNGVFANISALSVAGNNGLCGGMPEFRLRPCPARHVKHRSPQRLLLQILIPVGLVSLLIALALYTFSSKTRSTSSKNQAEASFLDNYPRVSYAELAKATAGFPPSNLIGEGKYGSVYRGVLPQTSKDSGSEELDVAVKVFQLHQSGSSKSFLAECDALRRVRHRNVVGILTCCSSIDHRGDEFKTLVFKFMPRYSLDRWLHHEGFDRLSLIQRLNIAVDVASALCYFHNDCQPPVVHCDLKPSNILLDEEFTARVGDFGLAKVVSDLALAAPPDGSGENSASSLGIRGTVGYVAPEYGVGGEVSTSGDVYSFGIVLLEMIIGKAPTDEMFRDGLSLHSFAAAALPENVLRAVDPVLLPQQSVEVSGCLSAVVGIGVSCSKQLLSDRMSIGSAAVELRALRDAYLSNVH